MTDKKAITIMGAGDDSGGAIVVRFVRKGYIACATRRTDEKRHPLVNETRAAGGQAHAFASGVRNEDEMVALIE